MAANHTSRGVTWPEIVGIAAIILVTALIVFPMFRHSPPHSPTAACLSNLKQIGTAMYMYAEDCGYRMPVLGTPRQRAPAGQGWPDVLRPYIKTDRILRCPACRPKDIELTYSFNRRLSGVEEKEVAYPPDVVMAFDTVSDSPANNNLNADKVSRPSHDRLPVPGSLVVWPSEEKEYYRNWPEWARARHKGTNNVLFFDGHAKTCGPRYEPVFDPKGSPASP